MKVNLSRFEFLRRGMGAVPPAGSQEGSAIHVDLGKNVQPLRSCTCLLSKRQTCPHLRELDAGWKAFRRQYGPGATWDGVFSATVWYRLARLIFESNAEPYATVRVSQVRWQDTTALRILSSAGRELALYVDASPARLTLLERLGKAPPGDGVVDRAALLQRLALFQTSAEERHLHQYGMKTQRQTWEESFWHRLAYHVVRTFGSGGTFHPAIDRGSGDFTLAYHAEGAAVLQVVLPRPRVQMALRLLAEAFPGQEDLAIHPLPVQSIFRISPTTTLDLEVEPVIRALQADGEERFFKRDELEKFRYGRLVYVPELGILAELESPDRQRTFRAPVAVKLRRSQVPSYLAEHGEALQEGSLVLDDSLRGLALRRDFDQVEIEAELGGETASDDPLGRSWYHLAVRYRFGDTSVPLSQILFARRQGLPYLEVQGGWIDLASPAFDHLERLALEAGDERLKLSAGEVLRFRAETEKPLRLVGRQLLQRLLDLAPAAPFVAPAGLRSVLRPYQRHGVDWLRFLYENRLGGLLCDDMGLGKTHQVMALMVVLREQLGVRAPFLVVCPTTVLPHWRDKLRDYAPGLEVCLYHGGSRDLAEALRQGVVLTSYGVLRRDEELAAVPFALAVFDEVQHLKNRGTVSFESAERLVATVKLGLTGTPVENSLDELKALFDLVLPGYLGRDEDFFHRYLRPVDLPSKRPAKDSRSRLAELQRLVAPFVLRRLKSAVLDELPAKIEDLRTCSLSTDQVGLYRAAIRGRGRELARRLQQIDEPLPYLHVFALLSHLKQICNHPALALHQLDRADDYRSGKWDLYREILGECLESGLKVVVFTQYLGMIELMQRDLDERGVESVQLTGASRRRGELVDRFNRDPSCRVFLGSLKAGGTGIDLVGGSVVIHYDRWWTAAREDQATDRVHRLGQHRAVQVFKLITEGTLEEKIAAIIERKRQLLEDIVQEDDPRLAKIFSRQQLLELLQEV